MTKIRTLLPVALLLSACATNSVLVESQNYSRLGEHTRAFELLDEAREQRLASGQVIDEEFEKGYQRARAQYLLERGRQRIFVEREDEALVDLAGVLAIDPDLAEAKDLRERALEKKATRATYLGDEHLFKNELEQALTCYLEAEKSVPGFPAARTGADKVHEAVQRLTARAQTQFLEAVRKMPEFRFVEVRWHAGNAFTNDPTRSDAESLKVRANREIALKSLARSAECRKKDQFGAALVELRSAKRIDPTLPGIDTEIEQMQREVEASALAEKATILMRSGRFDEARANLDKAFQMSQFARASLNDMMVDCRRLEGERTFQTCRDLEILGKKREALAAFEALVAKWPAGVKDEKARIDGLRTDIEGAEKEWAEAEAAEAKNDLPAALEHFQASERYYGEYKNAKERIARLKERIHHAAGS